MTDTEYELLGRTTKDLDRVLRRLLRKGQCGPGGAQYELYHAVLDAKILIIQAEHHAYNEFVKTTKGSA